MGLKIVVLLPKAFTHTSDCSLSELASTVFAVYTDIAPLFSLLTATTRALQSEVYRRISLIVVRNLFYVS